MKNQRSLSSPFIRYVQDASCRRPRLRRYAVLFAVGTGMLLPAGYGLTISSGSGSPEIRVASFFPVSDDRPGGWPLEASDWRGEAPSFDLPVSLANTVENYIEYYRTDGRSLLQGWLDRSGHYERMIKSVLREMNLPAELAYLPMIESGYNQHALSPADAAGLWQMVPETARRYGLRVDAWVDERRDPVKSTRAAAAHLHSLYKLFGSWPLALASYNAGETRVKRAVLRTPSPEVWRVRTPRYLPRETRNYVPKFLAAVAIASDPERYGFTPPPPAVYAYEEIVVPQRTDLRLIARCAGVDAGEIRNLNPELLQGMTPPDLTHSVVKLPPGTKKLIRAACSTLASQKAPAGETAVSAVPSPLPRSSAGPATTLFPERLPTLRAMLAAEEQSDR